MSALAQPARRAFCQATLRLAHNALHLCNVGLSGGCFGGAGGICGRFDRTRVCLLIASLLPRFTSSSPDLRPGSSLPPPTPRSCAAYSTKPEATVYSGPTWSHPSRVTLRTLRRKHRDGERLTMVTAYDYPSAAHVSFDGLGDDGARHGRQKEGYREDAISAAPFIYSVSFLWWTPAGRSCWHRHFAGGRLCRHGSARPRHHAAADAGGDAHALQGRGSGCAPPFPGGGPAVWHV